MKINTSVLIGPALNWAVAEASGILVGWQPYFITTSTIVYLSDWDDAEEYSPSTNWAQGGPIIERESISVAHGTDILASIWQLGYGYAHKQRGPTPLIAAMRCFVASKLGDEVGIPQGLTYN